MSSFFLRKMRIVNFKGIASREIVFPKKGMEINGFHATGKSTLQDAYHWCLWGKNAADEAKFNVKTLDENNKPIHRLDHEVELEFVEDNGATMRFRRLFKENWVKKRMEVVEVLDGHYSELYVNGVKCNQADYNAHVQSIFPEDIGKMITDPLYFNEKMDWNERRRILLQIQGGIHDDEIIATNPDLLELKNHLASLGKKSAAYRSEMMSVIDAQRKAKADIPTRISEAQRIISELPDENKIKASQAALDEIDSKMSQIVNEISNVADRMKAMEYEQIENIKKRKAIRTEIESINNQIDAVLKAHKKEASAGLSQLQDSLDIIEQKKNEIQSDIAKRQRGISSLESELQDKQKAIISLRQDYDNEYKSTFPDTASIIPGVICKSCGQKTPDKSVDVTALKAEFEQRKYDKLVSIQESGVELKAKIENTKDAVDAAIKALAIQKEESTRLDHEIDELKRKISAEKAAIDSMEEPEQVKQLRLDITAKEKQLSAIVDPPTLAASVQDNDDLKKQHKELMAQRSQYASVVSSIDMKSKQEQRIEELKNQESGFLDKINEAERWVYLIDLWDRIYFTLLEERVNRLFSIVKYKLFDTQLNGIRNPICQAMIDGVPWSDLNTSAQINAGLDTINVLQKFYDRHVPIWIDNRESALRIIDTDAQTISLKATYDKELVFVEIH